MLLGYIILGVVFFVTRTETAPLFGFPFPGPGMSADCPFPRDYSNKMPYINPQDPAILDSVKQVVQMIGESLQKAGCSLNESAVSVSIVINQTMVWSGGLGTTDYQNLNAPPPTGDTIYKIASQTKVFTTFMMLMLRDAGVLNLEDSVMEKFPKFRLAGDPYNTNNQITFKHLATQLSALPRSAPTVKGHDAWDVISKRVYPLWAPGTLPSYSNLGFAVLGRSLAELIDQEYEDWVQNNILKPLNMTSSGFLITPTIASKMPTIRGYNNEPWPKITSLDWENPGGQLYASVNDMARFMSEIFSEDDTPIKRRSINEALSPYFNDFDGAGGFGMPFEMLFFDNLWVMTKAGALPGFYSTTAFVKELKVGLSISTSTPVSASGAVTGISTTEVALEGISTIVNTLKNLISIAQASETYPPPTDGEVQNFLGCYKVTSTFQPVTYMNITRSTTTGEFAISGAGLALPIYFRTKPDDTSYLFQLAMQPELGCFFTEVEAYEGQYLVLERIGTQRLLYLELIAEAGTVGVQIPCS